MNMHAQVANQNQRGIITVQATMPSKGPGKSAWVKDTDGVMFGIWPDKLGLIRNGESYEIEFTETVKNGTTYRDIKHVRAASPPSPPPHQFTAQHGQPPARSLPAAAAQPGASKENGNSGSSGFYRPTSPRDARRMFLCSTLNAFIQTGRVDLHRESILLAITEITAAYDNSIGLEDQPQS